MVTFISFYSDDKLYTAQSERLVASLDKFNLKHEVVKVPPFSSWLQAVNYKPRFCLDMLNKYKSDLVWLDCDAEVVAYPKLFDTLLDCDIAVTYRDRPQIPHELLTGTIFLAYNTVTLDVVSRWKEECERYQMMDQIVLKRVLTKIRKDARVYSLPHSYTKIFDANDMNGSSPVIIHWQASREKRKSK